MRACIVSTYPFEGSKNIGDKLIEESTKCLLQNIFGISEFDVIWRGDISNMMDAVNKTSLLVYACLAVRRHMVPAVYNLPSDLSKLSVPMIVIASGTALSPIEIEMDELGSNVQYDEATIKCLHDIESRAIGFSCRGEITYNILKNFGLQKLRMTGDIAFWEPRFNHLRFCKSSKVKNIAVSTPHNPGLYSDHFFKFLFRLQEKFQSSAIHIILHGVTPWLDKNKIENLNLNCTINNIYEKDISALDIYSNMDMHIGYRVHAHVSALKRRIPSYLFAIDGRGADYARTLPTGTAVKAWKINGSTRALLGCSVRELARSAIRRLKRKGTLSVQPNFDAIDYLVDLMRRDADEGFARFVGFEQHILETNSRLENFIKNAAKLIK